MSFWPPEKGRQHVENISTEDVLEVKNTCPLAPFLLCRWVHVINSFWGRANCVCSLRFTCMQSLAAHLSRSTTWIAHARSTNSVNAKMLMPTFTKGCEVGLFKQREVCKVSKRITHSQCASEEHTFVNQQRFTISLNSSIKSMKYWACNNKDNMSNQKSILQPQPTETI